MKDVIIRALKTFAQAFFGVLIPEVVVILQGGFPESWSVLWAYLSPVVAAALAAAISAVWNSLQLLAVSAKEESVIDTDNLAEVGGSPENE